MFSTLFSTKPEHEATSNSLLAAVVLHVVIGGAFVWSSTQREAANNYQAPAPRELTLDLLLVPEQRLRRSVKGTRSGQRHGTARQLSPMPTLPDFSEATHNYAGADPAVDIRDFAADWSKAIEFGAAPLVAITDEDELIREPRVTYYSRAPVLDNLEQVQRLLLRRFPNSLRRAGGEARAILWLFINARGDVLKTVLRESSGRVEVDSVALRTGHEMRFQPARLAGAPVPVWVQMPIRMRVQDVLMR